MMGCTMTFPSDKSAPVLWVGLAECVPTFGDADLFDGGKGAFVNVVGFASSKEIFSRRVVEKLQELSATMVSLEDVEPYEERTSQWEIDDDLQAAAAAAAGDGGDVVLATLDIYMDTDE